MGFVFNLIYKKIGLLFCLCSVVPIIGVSPQYSYECNENGDIIILGLSERSEIKILDVLGDNGQLLVPNCSIKANQHGHAIINSNCTLTDLQIKDNRIVIFNVSNGVSATSATNTAPRVSVFPTESFSRLSLFPSTDYSSLLSTDIISSSSLIWMSTGSIYTTPTLSTSLLLSVSPTTTGTSATNNGTKSTSFLSAQSVISPSPSIIVSSSATSQIHSQTAASARFKIICQEFKNGYIKNVIDLLGTTNIVPMVPVFNSVGRVEMRFKTEKPKTEEDLKYLPDISTVYVGDKFYMILKYIGQQDYKIVPQKCYAYDGGVAVRSQTDTKVLLWSFDDCVSDEASEYHLMHNFDVISNEILFAEMFGFHFVDDADISVECDVMICRKSDSSANCRLKKTDCRNKSKWKVKRSLEENDVMVTGRLKVKSRRQHYSSNKAEKKKPDSWFILIIGAIVYTKNV